MIYLVPPFRDIVQDLFQTTPIVLRAVNKDSNAQPFQLLANGQLNKKKGFMFQCFLNHIIPFSQREEFCVYCKFGHIC